MLLKHGVERALSNMKPNAALAHGHLTDNKICNKDLKQQVKVIKVHLMQHANTKDVYS